MRKILLLVTTGVAMSQSHAHDFLEEILVYSDEYDMSAYQVMAHYNLTLSDLENNETVSRAHYDMQKLVRRSGSGAREEYRRVGSSDCDFGTEAQNKTCGVIDPFSQARAAAVSICHGFAAANLLNHSLIPQFIAPDTFTSATSGTNDHHVMYDLSQGLEFNCVQVIGKDKTVKLRN